MSERYKVRDSEEVHFVTFTIIDWIDLFTRDRYGYIMVDSLNYCIEHKGLVVYAYVIMPSHVHMLISSHGEPIPVIGRDLKKFTSKRFAEAMMDSGESRSKWLEDKFSFASRKLRRGKDYKVWKDGYNPKIMDRMDKLEAVFNYIHYNPVAAGYVTGERSWKFSSARAYEDNGDSDVKITSWF